jgi:hypothetical protein
MFLPVAIAEHHSFRTTWILVRLREPASDSGRNLKCLQHALADQCRADLFRFGKACDVCCSRHPDPERLKCPILLAVGEIHRGREGKASREVRQPGSSRSSEPDSHQLIRFWIRQRLDQYAVEHAEDGRIGAYTNRQCEDDSCSESRRLRQPQECEPHISPEALEARPLPRFPAALANQGDIAEFAAGSLRGFLFGHTIRYQFLPSLVEVFPNGERKIVITALT